MKKIGKAHTRVLSDNEFVRQFHKTMDKFTSHGKWYVFTDFLRLATDMYLSDRSPDNPHELHYMQTIGKYSHAEAQLFGELLAYAVGYMRATNREIVSELWEEYASNEQLGQFFTPWSVCQLMADLNYSGIDWTQYTREKPCIVSDPSCGGGRTLFAVLKKVPANKMDSVLFHGIDIDGTVCRAAALNMLWFNANSYIVHGNALTMEVWRVYQTVHTPFGGDIREITDPDVMQRIITIGLKPKEEGQ